MAKTKVKKGLVYRDNDVRRTKRLIQVKKVFADSVWNDAEVENLMTGKTSYVSLNRLGTSDVRGFSAE